MTFKTHSKGTLTKNYGSQDFFSMIHFFFLKLILPPRNKMMTIKKKFFNLYLGPVSSSFIEIWFILICHSQQLKSLKRRFFFNISIPVKVEIKMFQEEKKNAIQYFYLLFAPSRPTFILLSLLWVLRYSPLRILIIIRNLFVHWLLMVFDLGRLWQEPGWRRTRLWYLLLRNLPTESTRTSSSLD